MAEIVKNSLFVRKVLDAVPSIIIIADEDVKVLYRNLSARDLFKGDKIYKTRAGEAMNCINARTSPEGCGRSPACRNCAVRSAVNKAFAGKRVRRAAGEAKIVTQGKTITIPILVSASVLKLDGVPRALIVVEDISELMELRSLLPICCACKKIRTIDNKWLDIEQYLEGRSPELSLTHGICPSCMKKLYPDFAPDKR